MIITKSIFLILIFIQIQICFSINVQQPQTQQNDIVRHNEVILDSESDLSTSDTFDQVISSNPQLGQLNSSQLSSNVQSFYSKFPRYDFKGNSMNNTFAPFNRTYIESIILTGLPFDLIIILIIAAMIILVIGYSIYGIVKLIKNKSKFKYYRLLRISKAYSRVRNTPKQLVLIILTVLVLLITCTCLLLSIFVNQDLDKAILLSVDNLSSHIQNRVLVEDRIINETKLLGFYANLPFDALEIIRGTKMLNNVTLEAQQMIHKYENYRYQVIFFTTIALFVVSAIGILSVILRVKWSHVLFVGLGLVCIVNVWTIPASHIPMGVLISDLCPQMDNMVQSYLPSTIDPAYIQFFLNCTDQDSFIFVYQLLDQSVDIAQDKLNIAISHHYSNKTIDYLEKRLSYLTNLSVDSKNMLNCNVTSNTYKSTQNIICINILNSSFTLLILFIGIGLLLSLAFILSLCLYKSSKGMLIVFVPKKDYIDLKSPLLKCSKTINSTYRLSGADDFDYDYYYQSPLISEADVNSDSEEDSINNNDGNGNSNNNNQYII
ncbi:hypothetical protein CYY_008298 [Polysphondylium violaceum]|uniref:Transmembrane protein n=1 Tax=Polysphondylium violaceum TaxID=133409 RepID=A0A8J4PNK9_9MYCE|nr:hypothetical protein CYY_008298 [Polysphondylium violaceum]